MMSKNDNRKRQRFVTATALAEFVARLQGDPMPPRQNPTALDERRHQGVIVHRRHDANVRRFR